MAIPWMVIFLQGHQLCNHCAFRAEALVRHHLLPSHICMSALPGGQAGTQTLQETLHVRTHLQTPVKRMYAVQTLCLSCTAVKALHGLLVVQGMDSPPPLDPAHSEGCALVLHLGAAWPSCTMMVASLLARAILVEHNVLCRRCAEMPAVLEERDSQ